MNIPRFGKGRVALALALAVAVATPAVTRGQEKSADDKKPDWPPLSQVTEGYKQISGPDGEDGFYKIWYREKDNQMLAELPKDFAKERHFIALTVASGTPFAGLQTDDFYVH